MEGASAGGAQQMMQMAQKLMEALQKKGGGGGGGGGEQGGGGGFQDPYAKKEEPNAVSSILDGLYTNSASSSAATSRINDLIENIGSGTPSVAEVANILSEVATGRAITSSPATTTTLAATTSVATTSVTTAKNVDAAGATVSVGGRSGQTGVGAFFSNLFRPSDQAQAPTFFNRLCTTRPWQSGVISTVFSTSFFDTLCTSNLRSTNLPTVTAPVRVNTAAATSTATTTPSRVPTLNCPPRVPRGAPALVEWHCPFSNSSSGIGFVTQGRATGSVKVDVARTTALELICSSGRRTQCTIEVGEPKVELEGSPLNVALGSRARLYWTTEGVSSCVLEGAGMRETSLSGAATTPAIYDRTVFTITCTGSDGQKVTDKVSIDVGL